MGRCRTPVLEQLVSVFVPTLGPRNRECMSLANCDELVKHTSLMKVYVRHHSHRPMHEVWYQGQQAMMTLGTCSPFSEYPRSEVPTSEWDVS